MSETKEERLRELYAQEEALLHRIKTDLAELRTRQRAERDVFTARCFGRLAGIHARIRAVKAEP